MPFIGEIRMFAGNYAPRDWALCDGQELPIANYTALFSIIGYQYGMVGDGRTWLKLPDLRGRVPIHVGSGPDLTPRAIGDSSGGESTTLGIANLPAHNHPAGINGSATARASAEPGNRNTPVGNTWAPDAGNQSATYADADPTEAMRAGTFDLSTATVTVENTGGSQAFDHMPPFLVVNFIIALQGDFPSRT